MFVAFQNDTQPVLSFYKYQVLVRACFGRCTSLVVPVGPTNAAPNRTERCAGSIDSVIGDGYLDIIAGSVINAIPSHNYPVLGLAGAGPGDRGYGRARYRSSQDLPSL